MINRRGKNAEIKKAASRSGGDCDRHSSPILKKRGLLMGFFYSAK